MSEGYKHDKNSNEEHISDKVFAFTKNPYA